ncbi:polysaccharide biosynthesis protein [Desulfosarcina variabilis str. Montpellier]|uniref:lipopolysaccharide biosynthesis protein n=1 Tax=Desulfosarcina variabilis TaxID=2300 RepID=UPI003AFB1CDE
MNIPKFFRGKKILRKWVQDDHLHRLFTNASVLFSGNVISSLIGIVSMAMTARSLGVEQYGILVLITTYVVIVDNLVNFQSWQAIIKYGSDALEQKSEKDFKALIKFGFLIDISTALLGTLIAISFALIVGKLKGWDDHIITMINVFSITILFNLKGVPIAILRLFNKFHKIANQKVFSAVIKLLGITIAYFFGVGIWSFLLIFILCDIIGKLILIYFAYNELVKRRYHNFMLSKSRNISDKFSGIWKFAWTSNIHSSVRLSISEIDIVIIGAMVGASNAGLYKIVKKIGSTLMKLSSPLYQAIYPEIAKSISASDYCNTVNLILSPMKIITILAGFLLLLFLITGKTLITLILGAEYIGAYLPTMLYLIGSCIAIITFSFQPTMLSLNKAQLSLLILLFTSLIYLVFVYFLVNRIGIIGASLSYIIFYMLWAFIQGFAIIKAVKGRNNA